ncbi:MAG: DJ-1/PfpI family protein [Pseudobdellovibrionaceae bacterium]|nr:DJ-1/PfpI family protein [Pseudobdellovibrionaceae bacterium]
MLRITLAFFLTASTLFSAALGNTPRALLQEDGCNVLVAMSDADTLIAPPNTPFTSEPKEFQFGYLLNEMTVPVNALLTLGCQMTFATPSGKQPIRDPQGDNAIFFADGARLIPTDEAKTELQRGLFLVEDIGSPIRSHGPGSFDQPLSFSELKGTQDLEIFDAIFIPGGYTPMLNLWNDEELGRILRWFHAQERLTVTLCRGGVALASAANKKGWIYEGYSMTTYATIEDNAASVLNMILPFYRLPFHPSEKLLELGAIVKHQPFKSNIVEDRELLTGENQWSAHALANRFVERLDP